jgi:hypothetical protein
MTPLSASRIKTLKGCSWKYFCNYILKLPKDWNEGSARGSASHDVLEILARPDRKKRVKKLLRKKWPFDASIEKLIRLKAQHYNVGDKENILLIKDFLNTALRKDFFGESLAQPDEDHAELTFDLSVDKPEKGIKYRILGFIDRLFLYRKKGLVLIRDYKTSKQKYKGEDISDNLQDLFYTLAAKSRFPKIKESVVEFLFLKFDHDVDDDHKNSCVLRMDSVKDCELEGLEHELTHYQQVIDEFDEESALENFAYNQGFPSDDSFSGRLQCGFAKYKGQLKKDGSLMWHCPYKFPYDFYRVYNKEGKEIDCVKDEDLDLDRYPSDCYTRKYKYAGCPVFNK